MISLPTSPPFLYVSGVCQYIQFEEWSYLSTLEIKEKLIRELGQRKEGADQVARENGNGGGHPSVRPAPVKDGDPGRMLKVQRKAQKAVSIMLTVFLQVYQCFWYMLCQSSSTHSSLFGSSKCCVFLNTNIV